VEVDMNRGNLKFFLNGEDLGVAFTGSLRGQQIIPGVCFGGQVGSKVSFICKFCDRFPSLCVVVCSSKFGVVDTSFLSSVICAGSCFFCLPLHFPVPTAAGGGGGATPVVPTRVPGTPVFHPTHKAPGIIVNGSTAIGSVPAWGSALLDSPPVRDGIWVFEFKVGLLNVVCHIHMIQLAITSSGGFASAVAHSVQ
jgi:hypothetical protein